MSLTYSPKIISDGLIVYLDPSQNKSYPSRTLPVKDGLIMWMDAADDSTFSYSSGTTVSQWRDKSGYNYHMTPVGSAPTRNAFLNSRKVLAFTNTQDIQNSVIDLRTSPYTIFVVDRYTNAASGTGRILTSNGGYNNWLLGHWASEVNKYYANGWVYSTYAAIDTNWKLYLGDWGGPSNDLANFYGAGTAIATNSADASAGPWTLGINANSGERSNCEAAEIIVFNRLLTATERKLIHTYLGQKWGIGNTDRSIIDLSGNNNHAVFGSGTVANMPVADYYNKNTLRFDGISDYAIVSNPGTFSSYTFMFFCKWISDTAYGSRIFGVDNFGTYTVFTPSNVAFHYNQAAGTSTVLSSGVSVGLDNWCQVAVSVSPSYTKIYINGIYTNGTPTGPYISVAGNFFIGAQSSSTVLSNSNIGTFQFYNRVLSDTEILRNYEAQKSKFINTIITNGLVLNFDAGNPYSYAGAGTTWYDVSGNSINASATGSPTYSTLYGGVLSIPTSVSSYFNTSTVSTLNLGSASFSMECWVYLDAATGSDNVYRGIISLGTNASNYVYIAKWRSGLYSGLYVQYIAGASTITGVYQASDYNPVSRWTHVVATKSSNVLYLYVNGSLYSTASDLNTTFTGNSSVYIAQAHGGVASLYGYVGESRVYNISLSAAQVLQNFNATRGRYGL